MKSIKPKKIKLCILCNKNEATLPDRNKGVNSRIKKVCSSCHAARLVEDLQHIIKLRRDIKNEN